MIKNKEEALSEINFSVLIQEAIKDGVEEDVAGNRAKIYERMISGDQEFVPSRDLLSILLDGEDGMDSRIHTLLENDIQNCRVKLAISGKYLQLEIVYEGDKAIEGLPEKMPTIGISKEGLLKYKIEKKVNPLTGIPQ